MIIRLDRYGRASHQMPSVVSYEVLSMRYALQEALLYLLIIAGAAVAVIGVLSFAQPDNLAVPAVVRERN